MTNIELPRDAAGLEIPLDTKVLYDGDGNAKEVQSFDYSPLESMWRVLLLRDFILFLTSDMYLTPPDSWEKLLDDLDNAAKGGDNAECCYTRRDGIEVGEQCPGCRLYEQGKDKFNECSCLAYADIAARIRKLRSECE